LILTVLGGLAEFERSLIAERTAEGRVRANAKGGGWGGRRCSQPSNAPWSPNGAPRDKTMP